MSLSAVAYLFVNARLLGVSLPFSIYAAAFLGTWSVYLWDAHASSEAEDLLSQPGKSAFINRHPWLSDRIAPLSFVASGLLVMMVVHRWLALSAAALVGVFGMAYCFRLLPDGRGLRKIKDFAYFKTFAIPTAWLLGGFGLPLVMIRFRTGNAFGPSGVLALIGWLLLFFDTLVLDLRDLEADRRCGIQTLATEIGSAAIPLVKIGLALTAAIAIGCAIFSDVANPLFNLSSIAMTATLGVACYVALRARVDEISFGLAIAAWRFVGAAILAIGMGV